MAEPSSGPSARLVWSVSALLIAAGDALASRFGACSVRGEVSGFNRAGSGHCYFTLKDGGGAAAALRCAMFRRAALLLDFEPRDGEQVELRGRIALFEPRGELQFVVESMRRVGAGTLYEQFLRLKAKLDAEGLFDMARKRALPPQPATLGVVTSLDAAALHDVLSTLARRAPHVRVVVYPSPVQGADAPAALVRALHLAARRREADALILCRGGGSLEDLWAFNDERLARAVAASPIPVVCGVGHETDVSLADFAADVRAPTPTAAAELAAPSRDDLLRALQGLAMRLQRQAGRQLEGHAARLDRAALRFAGPAAWLTRHGLALRHLDQRRQAALPPALRHAQRTLDALAQRLPRAAAAQLVQCASRCDALQARLHGLDPRRVLARGYAWVTDADGRPLLHARDLHVGQAVRAVWADGRADAQVLGITLD